MKDPEYKDRVFSIFRKHLDLNRMKTLPSKEVVYSSDFWRQNPIDFLLQEIGRYPLEGIDFIETALQSAPVRIRFSGLKVLKTWVALKRTPLSELMPDIYDLLLKLRDIEHDDDVKTEMNRLLEGEVLFDEETEDLCG